MSESAQRLLSRARECAIAGRDQEALSAVSEALALAPEQPASHYAAALVFAGLGRATEAETAFRRALALDPAGADPVFGLVRLLLSLGRNQEALQLVEQGCRLHPDDARGPHLLGGMYLDQGLLDGAIDCLRQAANLASGEMERWLDICADLGLALQSAGQSDAARLRYLEVLNIRPDHDLALRGLARLAELAGDPGPALTRMAPVVGDQRATPEMLAVYARLLGQSGRRDEAIGLLQQQLADFPPISRADSPMADSSIVDFPGANSPRPDSPGAESSGSESISAPRVAQAQQMPILFELAQLLDAAGEAERAMACALEANRLKQARFDPRHYRDLVDRLLASFSADQMARLPRSGLEDQRPLLIVGMPRSGSSLTEQILASHPGVVAGGERAELGLLALATAGAGVEYPESVATLDRDRLAQMGQRYLEGMGPARRELLRFTDKMWQNFEFLGLAELMLPGARVVHCVREPLDCGLSCFFHHFFGSGVAFSYDLEHIGAYIGQYRRIMAHWREVLSLPMFDLDYESLVTDPERTIRGLLEFAGLPWDPACLNFHQHRREVRTASFDQVRQPLYRTSVGRHRRYRQWLEPMVKALADT